MFTSDLLADVRDRFCHVDRCPFTGPRIFLENAGGALTLKSVVETSATYAAIPDNQGRDNPASAALMATIDECRRLTHTLLGTGEGQVFTGESGTEVLFRLVRSAALAAPPGGRILGSSLEHPATSSARRQWAAHTGRQDVTVAHDFERGTVEPAAYRAAVTPDTRVATVIHTSPVTGIGVDLPAVVAEIRRVAPECLIIVDGIQHAAHGAFDLGETVIDGYAISPYKVFSRHGYGLGWASSRLTALPHERLDGSAPAQWELGTRDTGAYATFIDVVRYLEWLGGRADGTAADLRSRLVAAGRAIVDHERSLVEHMLHGGGGRTGLLGLPRVGILGRADEPAREGLVSLTVDGMAAADVVAGLRERGIRTHTRKPDHYSGNILKPLGLEGCVRVSLAHYNAPAEIDTFLEAMASIAG